MSGQPIKEFVAYKEPIPFESDGVESGIMFRSHVVMSDGQHLILSDAQHGTGWLTVDETLVFKCDEGGTIVNWAEVAGGRGIRTDEVVSELNESGYQSSPD